MTPHWKEVEAEWPKQKEGFIRAIITLMHKHFPEKIEPCPDCGELSLHLCGKAFREMCDTFFEKVYQHGVSVTKESAHAQRLEDIKWLEEEVGKSLREEDWREITEGYDAATKVKIADRNLYSNQGIKNLLTLLATRRESIEKEV